MQKQRPHSRVVGVGKGVDNGVEGVAAEGVVVDAEGVVVDAGGVDEFVIVLGCEEGVAEVAEEVLQEACDAVDVVVEGCWVTEVYAGGVYKGKVSVSNVGEGKCGLSAAGVM